MDRRQFLAVSGCFCSTVVAGCFGDDEESEYDDEFTDLEETPTNTPPGSTDTEGVQQANAAGWRQARRDSLLTGAHPGTTPIESEFTLSWKSDLSPNREEFSPEHVSPVRVTSDGAVYYAEVTRAGDSERVITLTRTVGGRIEKQMHGDIGPLLSGTNLAVVDLALADGRAVCSFQKDSLHLDRGISGELVVFDLSSGETVHDEEWPGGGPITVTEEAFYLGTVRMEARSPEVTTGTAAYGVVPSALRWHTNVAGYSYFVDSGSFGSMRPAVHDGTVYVSGADGLLGLDAATGSPSPFSEHGGFRIVDGQRGVLYAIDENGITGLDIDIGMGTVESVSMDGTPRGAALVDGILVVTADRTVTAFDVTTGETRWSNSETALIASLPSIAGDVVYYIRADGLVGRDVATGERIDASPVPLGAEGDQTPGSVSSQPVVAAGSVVVRADNELYAFVQPSGS